MSISGKIFINLFFFVTVAPGNKPQIEDINIHQIWLDCKLEQEMSFEIFNAAFSGFQEIDNLNKKDIISIIDFSKPSTVKRFFVIDLQKKKLIYNCLVAHGKNSGENYAESFSNRPESLKSSLGFFLTAETYYGAHGYSLRLEGLEKGINNNARARELVIHGAKYVSDTFIKKCGRLGRSWGCPALPVEISKEIIDKISGGSCLFIYADDINYKANSSFSERK
jgi:L,D-transpeptidase catalytic domain